MAVLLIHPYQEFFDDNGNPLSGGKVYTYQAGTDTPKATFTDNTENTEAANPVELDSSGRATMWGAGSYKFKVYDANDNLIRTTDNVTTYNTSSSTSDSFFQAFSGNGSQTAFTLSEDLGTDENAIMVFVDNGLVDSVINGTFATDTDWTKGAGWTIGAGVATAAGAISTAISQTASPAIVAGQAYDVVFTITRSAGGLIPSVGGQAGTERTAGGTYREVIVAGTTQTLAFTGNGFTGTLDNVTITIANGKGYEIQSPSSYSLSGTTLTLGTAPESGTGNIYVFAPSLLVGSANAAAAAADASATLAAASASAAAASAVLAGQNVKTKPNVACATTANITLSGEQTIDTVLTSASRVLVKNQINATENGVYVSAAGAWSRATDADTWTEIQGQSVFAAGGSVNINKTWANTNELGGTIGVTDITWTERPIAIPPSTTLTTPIINGNITGTGLPNVCEGRLTLTSGLPVTTADVTGATNIYFTPHIGNKVSLYTGSTWIQYTFTELTLALGTLTSGLPYDVFLDYNGGSPVLVSLAWTNDSTRATALAYQNGVLVKTGDTEQRYLGTFYTTATTTTEDSVANRYLWNYYNRVNRIGRAADSTASWSYSASSFQQARATAANQVNYVAGVAEDFVHADVCAPYVASSGATVRTVQVGIGLDSTTVNSAQTGTFAQTNNTLGSTCRATYSGIPAAGKHSIVWLEKGAGSDTQTWYTSFSTADIDAGITVQLRA